MSELTSALVVVDASAVLELLLRTPRADALSARLLRQDVSVHAPHLIDVEVTQVLRRYARSKELSEIRAAEARLDFAALPIERFAHGPLLDRIWELRSVLTAYDAAYVALAEALGARLVTCDAALARAAPRGVCELS